MLEIQPSKPSSDAAIRAARGVLIRQFVYAVFALLIVLGAQASAFFWWSEHLRGLLEEYGWWFFYLDVSVIFLVATIRYLRIYQYAQVNCMTGMMIGMSVGMQVGMMMGAVFGATDGYFVGCLVGMLLGTFFGVALSWCCGPMGITQGLMSGVMGGTMGSMIIVMMPPQKVMIFMAIFTLMNLAILLWFCVLFYRDAVIGEHCLPQKNQNFIGVLGNSVIALGLLTVIMLLFPKGATPIRLFGDGKEGNPFSINEVKKGIEPAGIQVEEMKCGSGMACGGRMRQEEK